MKSIMQDKKECWVTGCTMMLEKHHIYSGHGLRKISEENGFWIWLRSDLHTGGPKAIHEDMKFMNIVRAACQRKYEETHSRAEFMKLIGFNYLWEEEQ